MREKLAIANKMRVSRKNFSNNPKLMKNIIFSNIDKMIVLK